MGGGIQGGAGANPGAGSTDLHPLFGMCCSDGKIWLPVPSSPPDLIKQLFSASTSEARCRLYRSPVGPTQSNARSFAPFWPPFLVKLRLGSQPRFEVTVVSIRPGLRTHRDPALRDAPDRPILRNTPTIGSYQTRNYTSLSHHRSRSNIGPLLVRRTNRKNAIVQGGSFTTRSAFHRDTHNILHL